jgi:hypothetical protein
VSLGKFISFIFSGMNEIFAILKKIKIIINLISPEFSSKSMNKVEFFLLFFREMTSSHRYCVKIEKKFVRI